MIYKKVELYEYSMFFKNHIIHLEFIRNFNIKSSYKERYINNQKNGLCLYKYYKLDI